MIQVNQFNSLYYNPISEDQSVVQLRRHGQRVTFCVVHSSETCAVVQLKISDL